MQLVEAVQQEVGALSAQYLPVHGKIITIDFVGRFPYLLKGGGDNYVFFVVDFFPFISLLVTSRTPLLPRYDLLIDEP
jgi:hypothetical protein